MKKKAKKLVLAKETVGILNDRTLGIVAGGYSDLPGDACFGSSERCPTSAGPAICINELPTYVCA